MAILGNKRYRQCKQMEDGTIQCAMYKPTKTGEKRVTAMMVAQKTPDCKAYVMDEDGDQGDLQDLQSYLKKQMGVNCQHLE